MDETKVFSVIGGGRSTYAQFYVYTDCTGCIACDRVADQCISKRHKALWEIDGRRNDDSLVNHSDHSCDQQNNATSVTAIRQRDCSGIPGQTTWSALQQSDVIAALTYVLCDFAQSASAVTGPMVGALPDTIK